MKSGKSKGSRNKQHPHVLSHCLQEAISDDVNDLEGRWGASVVFLTRYDGELREPLMWHQGSQVSMRMARGSVSLLSSHGRGIRPQDALKTDS